MNVSDVQGLQLSWEQNHQSESRGRGLLFTMGEVRMNLCKEVTGEQGPHEGKGGDTWTSRQRKRHPQNRMWKGTGLLEGAAEGVVRRTGQPNSLDEWCLYKFQQLKGNKCCKRLTQGKLGGVWLQAWLYLLCKDRLHS